MIDPAVTPYPDDAPRYCEHGVDRAADDCPQCEEGINYDSPFYRPVGERYADGAYDDAPTAEHDEQRGAALAARFEDLR